MSRRLDLPDGPATGQPDAQGRLHAPSAARNCGPICELVARYAPERGRALELASGTGQHVAALALRLPGLLWQPSDVDGARLASIRAHVAAAAAGNVADPVVLDAAAPGWAGAHGGQDLVLVVNLLHLIPQAEARRLVTEAAQALAPGGRLIVYGPFMRAGELTSEGDRAFHASLVAQDPAIGYKDDFDTLDDMVAAGLVPEAVVEMPANNLALIARRES